MMHSPEISLLAPVDGIAVPIEHLPDPVFAQKMIGDGISIDPTSNTAHAPCEGVVAQLHRSGHALTIRTDHGVSVLVHIGLDTVHLEGNGFESLVHEGERVSAGQPLVRFDLDAIARGARSALTEVIVTEGATPFSFKRCHGRVQAVADEVLRFTPATVPSATVAQPSKHGPWSATVTLVNPHGLHARPAARLVREARKFDAAVELSHGERSAKATSVTELMNLDLVQGSSIGIVSRGKEAAAALAAIRDAIREGLGESPTDAPALPLEQRLVSQEQNLLGGIAASPGLAVGRLHRMRRELPHFEDVGTAPAPERQQLRAAIRQTRNLLLEDQARFSSAGETDKAEVFEAHADLLDDQGLLVDADQKIAVGASAARAWLNVVEERRAKFATLRNPLLRQRADDLDDVGRRVLHEILDEAPPSLDLGPESILVCHELTPSTVASLDHGCVAGIVTHTGGASSHAAIIARSMGIPYVAGISESLEHVPEGSWVILDGCAGSLRLHPEDGQLEAVRTELRQQQLAKEALTSSAQQPAMTVDHHRIQVAANIGSATDARRAVEQGCDGVGLLRSEFLFHGRRTAPTETEQRARYEEIARALGPQRSLVVRTLDVGGDKPLPYMPQAEEENPFLGVRGLRLSFRHPQIFRDQLRAVLAAAPHTRLHLMFPMVAQYDEFLRARDMLREEIHALGIEQQVAIGVMVEVPSAALNARWLAREVDFFSIGTNDLTQYTLAMDRGHSELSAQADALAPAVLKLIRMTVEAAHDAGRWVGVCGGLAADPLATPLLVGLDVDELSVPAPVIPEFKARVRQLYRSECRAIAEGALAMPSARVVRQLLEDFQKRATQAARSDG